jgi:spore germination protein KC
VNSMMVKKLLCAICIFFPISLSGCWSSHQVSELAISVCVGIDKSEKGYLVSEQIVNPRAIASKKPTNESPVILYTGEGENIENTIENLAKQSSRRIYNLHLRMVVISEEVAKEGVENLANYLMRSHEYRTDFDFVIAQGCSAKEILSVLTPEESIPGIEMYNKLALSTKETASTREVRLIELLNNLASEGINPVIEGAGIVGENGRPLSTDDLKKTPDMSKIRYTGLGAFDGDKFAGWLGEDESIGYNFITNHVKHFNSYSGLDEKLKITYDIEDVKSKIKARVEDGKPKITVDIKFSYNLVDLIGEFDITKPENTKILDAIVEDRIKALCENSVKKAQKDLKTDIFGFGERIHYADPKYWKKVKGNWNSVFQGIPVDIKVQANIKGTGEFLNSIPAKEMD